KGAAFLLRRAEELIVMASRRVKLCAAGPAEQRVPEPVVPGSRLQSAAAPCGQSYAAFWRDLRVPGRSAP
ncbi:MAG: hypothetical protein ACYC6Y_25330, partial [Thermoguttaceae bacterium]